jgi:hypothetical protein
MGLKGKEWANDQNIKRNCRYPESGVPPTTVWRRGARTAISSRTVNSTRPHRVDGSRGPTWREKSIHPRMYQLDRTPARKRRTPDYGPRLPSSKVRTTTRSWDRGCPGISKGPVLTRVQALSRAIALPAQAESWCCLVAYCLWHKPAGGAWRKGL